ncbi:AMP-dependent synthetase/ligase [Aeromicrobium wangtongii]|uniref:Acyl-CoA synthetase n=1 Tax=Aeromicrobium wangtongii TaxID=2969247 RepID=A0ABY5MG31_9ACTN|nr:AMP-dependent synthetase/ligase [Aeromicrobium wangtongii]MCD9197322.1 AMP-dependent synthetase/ligase [Aeromicrobium wangtongii]UUP14816.1 AMP-dependent synthetase/ligase [Aeromicrobium wangtongii]
MPAPVVTPEQLAIIENRPTSVSAMFFDRVTKSGSREAYRYPDENENWQSLTWSETGDRVSRLAAGLISLGIQPEERVAISSNTRLEWILADLAINAAGAATTTVYPTTMADDVAYILADSDSRIVFAEDDEQVAKLRQKHSELPSIVKVVVFDGTSDGDWVISFADLEKLGEGYLAEKPSSVQDRVAQTTGDSLATLIYTSGTTGRPKGVRLSHDGWVYEGYVMVAANILSEDDLQFLWLPMAHSFGKVLLTTQLAIGFPTAIDGRVPRIVDNLAVVQPTFMGAAPRIFEKAYGRIIGMTEADGGAKLKIFRWAEKVGIEYSRAVRSGKPVSPVLKAKFGLADKLVFSKVRARFGGRVRFFISGAAALSPDIAEWFHAAGVLILEGYGLTETSAGAFVNQPDNFKIGSVGTAFPGSEAKIAADGEVLIKGPHIMRGYHNLETESASSLTDEGWLHTGDEGRIDEDGFLFITGRKKELFKTSGGKYVAPPHIEGIFKGISAMTSQILVHGNERNFCSALITLDPDAVAEWADHHGMGDKSYTEVVRSPEIHALVQGQIDELNTKLNRWETIKKFAILDHDLSIESGEITPSMKVKRNVVEANNKAILDGFYA